jgi:hypothetical protein
MENGVLINGYNLGLLVSMENSPQVNVLKFDWLLGWHPLADSVDLCLAVGLLHSLVSDSVVANMVSQLHEFDTSCLCSM